MGVDQGEGHAVCCQTHHQLLLGHSHVQPVVDRPVLQQTVTLLIKLQKKSEVKSVQQSQFLLSNHCVILSWCTQDLGFIELPVNDDNSQSFYISLSVHHFVRNLLWQKCRGRR
jgi:hypothetical protein